MPTLSTQNLVHRFQMNVYDENANKRLGKARIHYKLPLVQSTDFIPEVQKHNEK